MKENLVMTCPWCGTPNGAFEPSCHECNTALPRLVRRIPKSDLDIVHETNWVPLENAIGKDNCPHFMYMCSQTPRSDQDGIRIHSYKHVDTRKYLMISDDGAFFRENGSWIDEIGRKEAMAHAEISY